MVPDVEGYNKPQDIQIENNLKINHKIRMLVFSAISYFRVLL
jgi:hypothetical protein